ncbi:hypothetical protein F53441_5947 [Fusarium austroafricanum]|uniref:Ecp2 effector protein domain-containing protein n=1 Tax=Fusarium austroafricanum TaxID=2364996 RepID=A0A8H4KGS5_9HYPO|nr:hypothetical protein F53441_5947 [Fusarium austroafricanum]
MRFVNAASLIVLMSNFVHSSPLESIERRSLVDTLQHGNYGRSNGKIYRYHEVHDGLFAGVAPEDWDDSVHVRGALLTERSDTNESPPSLDSNLLHRDISSACKTKLVCAVSSAASLGSSIYQYSGDFINKLREVKGSDVMDGLNQPFWANLAGVGGQNVLVTAIFYLVQKGTDKPPPVQQCSKANSQEDLLRQMITQACSSSPERTGFAQSITLSDGSVFELRMAAGPGHNLSDSQTCGAPSKGS